MKVEMFDYNGAKVIRVYGKFTIGDYGTKLRDAVLEVLTAGTTKIIIDLARLTKIDSAGIGELVHAYTTINHKGAHLRLINVDSPTYKLLEITRLTSVLQIYESNEEAFQSFEEEI